MKPSLDVGTSRRLFLKFLAGRPALAYLGAPVFAGQGFETSHYAGKGDGPITSPEDAINVFDFETVAQRELPPAHWGYMATARGVGPICQGRGRDLGERISTCQGSGPWLERVQDERRKADMSASGKPLHRGYDSLLDLRPGSLAKHSWHGFRLGVFEVDQALRQMILIVVDPLEAAAGEIER